MNINKKFGKKIIEKTVLLVIGAASGAVVLGALGMLFGGYPTAIIGLKIGILLGGGTGVIPAS